MKVNLDELNPQQRAAVETTEGPLLVVAGAGSGKTRVITTRIMYLMEQGVSPYQILAMTFTNKAAMEMKHRIGVGLKRNTGDLTITTFHSFCARFLRKEIGYLDREPGFAIFDTQDQTSCLKRVIRGLDLDEKNFPARHFRNKFSYLKNKGDLDAEPEFEIEQRIFHAYRKEMREQNALDFDDLLLLTCKILGEYEECRTRYQRRFQFIMVDEYQDTNKIQARLIRLLLNEKNNLCVVGDEDQSIYGWRGADIHNILDFELHYPGTRVFKLEQNYRSSQRILDYANEVISLNQLRKPKKLWTEDSGGLPISIRDEYSSMDEAENIVQSVIQIHESKKVPLNEFAILFRSNFLSRVLEEMFRRYQIPYQLIGGLKFYDRKEIKDLLSYMRIVVNPRDWTSFTRAIGVPSRGIGVKSLDKIYGVFNEGFNLKETMDMVIEGKILSGKGLRSLTAFRDFYNTMVENAEDLTPCDWLTHVIDELDYLNYLEKQDAGSAEYRADNIEELLSAMKDLEKQSITTLSQFMDFSALVSDQDEMEDNSPKVNMMTIHAAKGLEFDTVFVMALEDGIFPNQRALTDNPNAVEEERRLFYVAVTRARKRLYLSYARKRQTFGTTTSNPKSRFLLAPGESFEDEESDPFLKPVRPKAARPGARKFGDLSSQIKRMQEQLAEKDVDVDFGGVGGKKKPTRIRTGDVVRHAKFGQGTVSKTTGSGEKMTVTVYFPGVGKKTLVARVAKLEKVFDN
ncbi:MAG: UvrD-helicase domain-containing protein [Acidobacteriota bacterium]|nr:UvrD-helicase domain-containing protein [Acidobacteriota bacterium]